MDQAGAVLGDTFDGLVRSLGLDPAAMADDVRRITAGLQEGP